MTIPKLLDMCWVSVERLSYCGTTAITCLSNGNPSRRVFSQFQDRFTELLLLLMSLVFGNDQKGREEREGTSTGNLYLLPVRSLFLQAYRCELGTFGLYRR
ncbi:hypothetical protein ANN_22399 [Periplaneta americana]|uniref:Uncharacterized protein n=1 Tax=Periplaneta americana TaxID=6978 RepID=A0ABQ8S8I6_PERAM|nr:hypothetical protein ANN_22399 [Periplaneta americana]